MVSTQWIRFAEHRILASNLRAKNKYTHMQGKMRGKNQFPLPSKRGWQGRRELDHVHPPVHV